MPGLRWVKLDLHVHTWASKCFDKEGLSEEQIATRIVEHCISQGIEGIAVTDHMTGAAVDLMKRKAKKHGLTVFPGVEFAVWGGKRTLHIIGIFDEHKNSEHLKKILYNGNTKGDLGAKEAYCAKDPTDLAELITDYGGLVILPHPYSKTGVLGGQQGTPRQALMGSGYIAGLEYHKDVEQHFPGRAMYQASDGGVFSDQCQQHTVGGIGSRCSLFAMEEVTFEALRQCLVDHEVRILVEPSEPASRHPYIERLKVTKGFLDGLDVQLHSGLNALLGGKGVGKSLVVEFIRFALNQPPAEALRDIWEDHRGKLEKRLGKYGVIELRFRGITGHRYSLKRTYDGSDNPIEIFNLETSQLETAAPEKLMPLMVFSQREIMLMAERDEARREWLDRQLGIGPLEASASGSLNQLRQNDHELAEIIQARTDLAESADEIKLLQDELAGIRTKTDHPVAKAMDHLQKQKAISDDVLDYHDKIAAALKRAREELLRAAEPPLPEDSTGFDPRLLLSHTAAHEFAQSVLRQLHALEAHHELVLAAQRETLEAFLNANKHIEQEYSSVMGTLDTTEAELHARRVEIEGDLAKRIRARADNEKAAARLTDICRQRVKLLSQLATARAERTVDRQRNFNDINKRADGRIRIRIEVGADRGTYEEVIAGLKTQLATKTLSKLAQMVPVRDFVRYCLRGDAARLAAKAEIPQKSAEKLVEHATTRLSLEELLRWQHQVPLEDTIVLEYQSPSDPARYIPLDDLSVGQKSSAMTILALLQEYFPVIIDQPEDSLDIQGVYNDVVVPVRRDKQQRQFIFTTHNSTLAVAADSDVFVVLEAEAEEAKLANIGAIERETVKTAVIQHVEGGKDAYNLKRDKYGKAIER